MNFTDLMKTLEETFSELSRVSVAKMFNRVCDRQIRYTGESNWEYTGRKVPDPSLVKKYDIKNQPEDEALGYVGYIVQYDSGEELLDRYEQTLDASNEESHTLKHTFEWFAKELALAQLTRKDKIAEGIDCFPDGDLAKMMLSQGGDDLEEAMDLLVNLLYKVCREPDHPQVDS